MIKLNSPFPILLFVLLSRLVSGQPIDYKKDYGIAKSNLEAGNYDAALKGFRSLIANDPAHPMASYTSYFYGVTAFALDQKEQAKDMFLQIIKKYPQWNKIPDTYLWLSKIYFELSSPNQGMYYAAKVEGDSSLLGLAAEIIRGYLSQLDKITLASLLNEHDDTIIAEYLVLKMLRVPYEDQNYNRLDSLISYYKLDSARLGLGIPDNRFKEHYKVAVMLPLFSERLWESGVYMQKSLAVDIYEGIQLALLEFDSTKIKIEVFDTKKDSLTTSAILLNGNLNGADAIIGPLYPKPIELVANYSYESKVNFVNPVSTNSDLIEKNPFAFLLRTGGKTTGKLLAEFARGRFENKACAIYYGPRKSDSLAAFNYAERMLADSFHIVIMQRTRTDKARELFDSLTSSISVVDSVELKRLWEEGEEVQFMPLRDSLLLKVDSIGHIFIASDNKAIAAEVMAAITSRGDTTQIIGLGNWFSEANASLDIMEKLGVWLAMQEYEDMLLPNNIKIRNLYMEHNHKKPSKYFFYGYYSMKFIGNSLLKHGIYFQNGLKINGSDIHWFDYSYGQDNQRLVVFKLKNGVPRIINNSELE